MNLNECFFGIYIYIYIYIRVSVGLRNTRVLNVIYTSFLEDLPQQSVYPKGTSGVDL